MSDVAVCCFESRAADQLGLAFLIQSLQVHAPDTAVFVFSPNPSELVRKVCNRSNSVILKTEVSNSVVGWNCKPQLLQQVLDSGFKRAVWLDSDIILIDSIDRLISGNIETLTVATEAASGPQPQGAHLRCDTWGVTKSREIERTINTCFILVSDSHQALLRDWQSKIEETRYRETQSRPMTMRPTFALSDQDALNALLCDQDHCRIEIQQLSIGQDFIHAGHPLAFRSFDRIRSIAASPVFIHAGGGRPWSWFDREGCSWVRRFEHDLSQDCSHYTVAARRLADELGVVESSLKVRTVLGRLLNSLSLGHPSLRGWPITVLAEAVRMWSPRETQELIVEQVAYPKQR